MKRVIIIGGGITGLSVAWKLSGKGYEVTVIESDKLIGGLAKSVKVENYFFDIGPHSFFSEDKEVFKKVMDLFEGEPSEMPYAKRSVKMLFKGASNFWGGNSRGSIIEGYGMRQCRWFQTEGLIDFVKDRPGHDFRYSIDNSKIKNKLGWKPQYLFKKALEGTIDWYCNNKEWYNKLLNKDYNLDRLGVIKKWKV